jgi:hypothetical protein
MIVSSTGTSTTCLGAFLGAFLAAVFGDRCVLAKGFGARLLARRALDFIFFGVVHFVVFLRADMAPALPRFELFLRAATRFFAMIVSCEVAAGRPDLAIQAKYADIISQRFATPLLFYIPRMIPCAIDMSYWPRIVSSPPPFVYSLGVLPSFGIVRESLITACSVGK